MSNWNLSEEGYAECVKGKAHVSPSDVVRILSDTDLKTIAVPGLPDDFLQSKAAKVDGPLVLQVQKIRNISAPTVRQESGAAPRMFRFSLTDGCQTVAAIEMEPLHNMGFETAPGCKLQLKGSLPVNQGIILLNNGNCKLLGGTVGYMYERWKLNKDLMKLSRNVNRADGPPPFVPFGQKVKKEQIQQLSGKFKSLEVASANPAGEAEQRDNSEFNAQRKAEISAALQQGSGPKKTYGGIKQVTADEPLQMAEYKRPERKPKKSTIDDKDPNVSDDEEQGRGRGRRGRRGRYGEDEEDVGVPSRPSTANTLFDFLGDRLGEDKSNKSGTTTARPHTASDSYSYDHADRRHFNDDDQRQRNQGYAQRRNDDGQHNSYRNNDQEYNRGQGQRSNYGQSNTADRSQRPSQANTQVSGQRSGHNQSNSSDYGQRSNNRQSRYGSQNSDTRLSTSSKGGSHAQKPAPNQQNSGRNLASSQHVGSAHESPRNKGQARTQNPGKDKPHSGQGSSTVNKPKPDTSKPGQGIVTKSVPAQAAPQGNRQYGRMYSDDVGKDPPPLKAAAAGGAAANKGADKTKPQAARLEPKLRPGDLVLAKYYEDGQFYRFKVTQMKSTSAVLGVFLDYGNTEEVKISDTKPVNKPITPQGTKATPNQRSQPSQQQNLIHHQQPQYQPQQLYQPQQQYQQQQYPPHQQQYQPQHHQQGQYQQYYPPQHQHSEYQGDYRQGLSFGRTRNNRQN